MEQSNDSAFILKIKILELKALEQVEKYDKVIEQSNQLLRNYKLSPTQNLQIYLLRSVVYEILDELDKCLESLNKAKEYVDLLIEQKDEPNYFIGLYYIRKSSYYRILHKQTKNKNDYSNYLQYSNIAHDYCKKHNFGYLKATTNLLLGFNESLSEKETFNYLKESLSIWKSIEDIHGIASAYSNIAYLYKEDLQKALIYNDSAKTILNNTKMFSDIANVYEYRYQLFNSWKMPDSALANYILYRTYLDSTNHNKKLIDIKIINSEESLRAKKLKNKQLTKEIILEKKNSKRLVIVFFIILSLLIGLIYLYFKLSKKKKQISLNQIELAKSVAEKTLLLTELNHRVKNNMALILSLVQLQGTNNNISKQDLSQLEKRIQTMAMANSLYSYSSKDLMGGKIDLANYLTAIISSFTETSTNQIHFNLKVPSIKTKVKFALPIGIIFNELITNLVKHANVKPNELVINISILLDESTFLLRYEDNGTNFKKDVEESTGLFIIKTLTQQLKGTIQRENSSFLISFKNR